VFLKNSFAWKKANKIPGALTEIFKAQFFGVIGW